MGGEQAHNDLAHTSESQKKRERERERIQLTEMAGTLGEGWLGSWCGGEGLGVA